jgi:hypothetical protein
MWPPLTSHRLLDRNAPAEVVFGTLARFGVPFADQLVDVLSGADSYNAIHLIAARVLATGGTVWTPNVDRLVELAYPSPPNSLVCSTRDDEDELTARAQHTGDGAGWLVKFHGDVGDRETIAFTDLQLSGPLPEGVVEALSEHARGKRMMLYGYRGADADLRPLLEQAIDRAEAVVWFEPNADGQSHIRERFDDPKIIIVPTMSDDVVSQFVATAESFVEYAQQAALVTSDDDALVEQLRSARAEVPVSFWFPSVPAIVHARLVERFGRTADVPSSLAAARRADLLRLPPRKVGQHLSWWASERLRRPSSVARKGLLRLGARPSALDWIPKPARSYVVRKTSEALLPAGRFEDLQHFAEKSLSQRDPDDTLGCGLDEYYRGHGLRNAASFTDAIEAQDRARTLLLKWGESDTERAAGAFLERGMLAIHQGRVADARRSAQDLVNVRGQYAIGRWSGWGHWLSAMSYLYECGLADTSDPKRLYERALKELRAAKLDFRDADTLDGEEDVYIASMLAYRVRMATEEGFAAGIGRDEPLPETPPRPPIRGNRARRDVLLLEADCRIALGQPDVARNLLDEVCNGDVSPLTRSFADLGYAALEKKPHELVEVRDKALEAGRTWQAAVANLFLTGERLLGDATIPALKRLGTPPVLWLIT